MTVAVSLFVMPVIDHHLQYPYRDIEKFKQRSRRFIMFGLIPAGVTLYVGLEIALASVMKAGMLLPLQPCHLSWSTYFQPEKVARTPTLKKRKKSLLGPYMAARKNTSRKKRLMKRTRQNRPVPTWVVIRTNRKVRTNPKRRLWRRSDVNVG